MASGEAIQSYVRDQQNCQKYLGPPRWYSGDEPPHLTEIFLSNLGRDISEDQVFNLCYTFGTIYQIRLPVTFQEAKGFAYCRFLFKESAADAVKKLNGSTFRGKVIKVCLSMDTRTIQIMDIPKYLQYDSIRHILQSLLSNVKEIKINMDYHFALCTFTSHNAAQVNIRELKKRDEFGRVQWARGDYDLPEEYFLKVKDLYVGHLPPNCTIAELRDAISCVIDITWIVIKAHSSGYGFIYFANHEEAEAALFCLRATQITIRGQPITFNWLKGQYSKKRSRSSGILHNQSDLQNIAPNIDNWDAGEIKFNRAPGAEFAAIRRTRALQESQDSGVSFSFFSDEV